MKAWIYNWLGLTAWVQGIEQAIGECRILVQDQVRTQAAEIRALREENKILLDAFVALKTKPPEMPLLGRKVPASMLVQQQTFAAYNRDREG